MKPCIRLKPTAVAEIGLHEGTADERLRHAAFLRIRRDKKVKEVVRETEHSLISRAIQC